MNNKIELNFFLQSLLIVSNLVELIPGINLIFNYIINIKSN